MFPMGYRKTRQYCYRICGYRLTEYNTVNIIGHCFTTIVRHFCSDRAENGLIYQSSSSLIMINSIGSAANAANSCLLWTISAGDNLIGLGRKVFTNSNILSLLLAYRLSEISSRLLIFPLIFLRQNENYFTFTGPTFQCISTIILGPTFRQYLKFCRA